MQDLVFQFQEIVIGDRNRPRFIEKDLEKISSVLSKSAMNTTMNGPQFGTLYNSKASGVSVLNNRI